MKKRALVIINPVPVIDIPFYSQKIIVVWLHFPPEDLSDLQWSRTRHHHLQIRTWIPQTELRKNGQKRRHRRHVRWNHTPCGRWTTSLYLPPMLLTTFQSGRIGYCKKKRQGSYFISLSYRLYSSIAQESELHIFNQGIWNMTCMSTAFLFVYYSYSYWGLILFLNLLNKY